MNTCMKRIVLMGLLSGVAICSPMDLSTLIFPEVEWAITQGRITFDTLVKSDSAAGEDSFAVFVCEKILKYSRAKNFLSPGVVYDDLFKKVRSKFNNYVVLLIRLIQYAKIRKERDAILECYSRRWEKLIYNFNDNFTVRQGRVAQECWCRCVFTEGYLAKAHQEYASRMNIQGQVLLERGFALLGGIVCCDWLGKYQ
jgi:hypothetical protein